MSDSEHQPSSSTSNAENKEQYKKGGLLSRYKSQQHVQQHISVSQSPDGPVPVLVSRPLEPSLDQADNDNRLTRRMSGGLLTNAGMRRRRISDIPRVDTIAPSEDKSAPVGADQRVSIQVQPVWEQKTPSSQASIQDIVPASSLPQSSYRIPDVPVMPDIYGTQGEQQQSSWGEAPDAHGMIFATVDAMRQWTGRMAAIVGYRPSVPLPPAPYMEMYHGDDEGLVAKSVRQKDGGWKRSHILRVTRQMRQRRVRWHKGPRRIWVSFGVTMLILFLFTTFGGSAYAYSYYKAQLPKVQQYATKHMPQDTRIYDRNGHLLFEAYQKDSFDPTQNGRRIPVTYKDLPAVLQDAQIAIEDSSFWQNNGISFTGIARAATEGVGGGSTITQQLIKNLSGNEQYSLFRKIPEAAMAIGMTQEYPKTTILTMYFNTVPYGTIDLGVESAVEDYFHLQPHCDARTFHCTPAVANLDYNTHTKKHDPLLALARASLLAGIPNAPAYYTPTIAGNKQNALDRQAVVLQAMIHQHMKLYGKPITPAMAKQAVRMMKNTTFRTPPAIKHAPHFVDWVMTQVESALGNGDATQGIQAFLTGGYNIRTTIDMHLEEYVEHAVQRHLYQSEYQMFPTYAAGYKVLSQDLNVNSAAVVVLDSKTGEILAMDGSGGYDNANIEVGGQYNVAAPPNDNGHGFSSVDGKPLGRPPGSTFKPIVYATAFQMGLNPNTILPDTETFFPNGMPAGTAVPTTRYQRENTNNNGLYVPSDYGDTYHPNLYRGHAPTIHYDTSNSFNIPALKAMQFAGQANVLATARRMGITTISPNGISWAIGSQNAPLLQMTGAYQTFANDGKHIPPQGILDIYDSYGHDLYHYDPVHPPASQVLSPQVAYMVSSVLVDENSRYEEFGNDYDLTFADKDINCRYISGLSTSLNGYGCQYPVAAKTGTSDDFRDNLTIGYTPDVTVGVWAGNANNEAMGKDTVGITGAAPIWHSVIEHTLGWCNQVYDAVPCGPDLKLPFSSQPNFLFQNPGGLTEMSANPYNGLLGSGLAPDWIIGGQEPTQTGIPENGMPINAEVEPLSAG
ncbi:MAG TPA: transglycosylase domain-containing protein [Dictyobacter sp.]|jgi:membrane peptidoglycan carboxypeptidase|nr:transglycosylase domain-containing protein [Dictyobacter sp.]